MRIFPASAKYQRHILPSEHTLASISPSLVSQAMNLIISRLSGSRIIVCFRLPGFSPVTCQEVLMHSALSSETAISAFPMETNSPITAAGQHGSFTHFPLIARRYTSATLMTSVWIFEKTITIGNYIAKFLSWQAHEKIFFKKHYFSLRYTCTLSHPPAAPSVDA